MDNDKSYPGAEAMLGGLPRDLVSLFVPKSEAEWTELERRITSLKSKERVRKQVMGIQQLCGFPLRPNEALQEVMARARLQGMLKDRKYYRREIDDDDIAGWPLD